jgi:hypothetical protein
MNLFDLYVQDVKSLRNIDITKSKEFIDVSLCKTIKPHSMCNIKIFPYEVNSYLISVVYKDNLGNKYPCRQLINIANPVISNNGFTYFSEKLDVSTDKHFTSSISIPIILDDNYTKLMVSFTDKFIHSDVICQNSLSRNNSFDYQKGALCTIQLFIPEGTYDLPKNRSLIIRGTTLSEAKVNQVKIEFTLISNNVANIITSANNVIISPADGQLGNAKQVFVLNTGSIASATDFSLKIPSPLTITTNTCGTSIAAGGSCSFFVNVTSSLTSSGQVSMSLTYNDSSQTQLINFNVIYKIATASPLLTLQSSGSLVNTSVAGGVYYTVIVVTNAGNVAFTNLQFNSVNNQNQYMNYGASSTTCITGQSLAINASCVMIIGYNPNAVQALSSVTIIPTVNYTQNGTTQSYSSTSTVIQYSAINTNNYRVVGDYGSIATSTAVATWVATKNPPFANALTISNAITKGAGNIFVMGQSNGAVWGSSDSGGMFWTSGTPPGATAITSIIYNSTSTLYYLSGGVSMRTIMTAPNLSTAWATMFTATAGVSINSIYANANATVFIAPSTSVFPTSNNGISWTQQTVIAGSYSAALFDGTSTYYAFGFAGNSARSTNPTTLGTWVANASTVTNGAATLSVRSAVLNAGTFVAVGSGGTTSIYTTTNPQAASPAWVSRASTTTQLNSIIFGGSLYVTVGNSGTILTSSNATTWTARTSGTTANLLSVYYDGTYYWATGNAIILVSTDGITWNRITLNSLIINDSTYLAVGSNGLIYTSADLITWTRRTSGTTNILEQATCQKPNSCIVVGDAGTILTSSDLITWSPQTSGTTNKLNQFVCGITNCLIVGNSGTVLSTNNISTLNSWTTITPAPTANNLNAVDFLFNETGAEGNLFVAVGSSGTIITSPNGVNWTARTSGVTANINDVKCSLSSTVSIACVAVGATNGTNATILTSIDGKTWTPQTTGVTNVNLNAVMYLNGVYIAVGDSNTILTSSDAITWTSRTSNLSATTAINLRDVLMF